MASIQELIDICLADPTQEAYKAVRTAMCRLERIHAAFCPDNGHYYMEFENGLRACYLFTDEEALAAFTALHQELRITGLPIARRMQPAMLADLYRSGFDVLVLNAPRTPCTLALRDLIELPDYSALPLERQPVLSPEATGSVIYLAQKLRSGNADGVVELDVLRRLYHAPYILAALDAPGEDPQYATLDLPDGSRCYMAFTDPQYFERMNRDGRYRKCFVRFDTLRDLASESGCHILLNPGDGAQLPLDSTLLRAAEEYAQGTFGGVMLHSMKGDSLPAGIGVPEPWPSPLADALSQCFREEVDILTAHLFTIRKEHDAMPHYLIVLHWSGMPRTALYEKFHDAVARYASGWDLEFADTSALGGLLSGHEPFYER